LTQRGDNLLPFGRNWSPPDLDLPVPIDKLSEAVRAFGAVTRSLDEATSARGRPIRLSQGSTARFRLELPVAERCLEELGVIGVMNWPDTRWALSVCNARRAAVARLHALKTSLYPIRPSFDPAGQSRWERALLADAQEFAGALCTVRDMIVERYPQTRCGL
jgi:hypothetical protein